MLLNRKILLGMNLFFILALAFYMLNSFVFAFTLVEPSTEIDPPFGVEDGNVKFEAIEGPIGPEGLKGPQGDRGDKGVKGDPGADATFPTASCDWSGEIYISHGIDGWPAYTTGVWIKCESSKVTKMDWIG